MTFYKNNIATADNIGFAKAGVNVPCVESFRHFQPQKTISFFLFFVILKKRKWFLLSSVFNRKFRLSLPRLRKAVSRCAQY
ncbi:MAG: hypothetical protein BGO40_03500 [Chryseobacterium sp. 39-10]|nr:MAG: hypothetical protein BGO40_03500 [Chryseobacterium sp. 39-10]